MKKIFIAILISAFALGAAACSGETSDTESVGKVELSTTAAEETARETTAQTTTAEQTTAAETTAAATEKTTEKTDETKKSAASSSSSSKSSESSGKSSGSSSKTGTKTSSSTSKSSSSSKSSTKKTTYSTIITYNGVAIALDKDMNSIIASLGNPDSKQTSPACCTLGEDGKSHIYIYGNMTIYAYLSDNVEYVEDVEVMGSGSAASAKGITVGSTTSAVKKVFGTPSATDESYLRYTVAKQTVYFYIENDKVTGFATSRS